jgi:hypothetical protein
MLGEDQILIYRLQANDYKWRKYKKVIDRFGTLELDEWEFVTRWLKERELLRYRLRKSGKIYKDNMLDV